MKAAQRRGKAAEASMAALQRRVEELECSLRVSERRASAQAALTDASPTATVVHRGGHLLYANPAAARLLGYRSPAMLVRAGRLPWLPAAPRTTRAARKPAPRADANGAKTLEAIRKGGNGLTVRALPRQVDWEGAAAVQVTLEALPEIAHSNGAEASAGPTATLLEALPEFVAELAADGTILYANRPWPAKKPSQGRRRGNGRDPAHAGAAHGLVGESFLDLIAAKDRDAARKALNRCRRGGDKEITYPLTASGPGKGPALQATFRRVPKAKGRPTYLVTCRENPATSNGDGVLADRKRLQDVFDAIPAVVYMKDLQGRFTMVNRHLPETYGIAETQMIGLTAFDLHPRKEEAERMEETDRLVRTSGARAEFPEERVTLPDGTVRWRHMVKAPIRDAKGRITEIIGVRMDITQRKQAEEELHASRRLLQSVFDTIPHALFVKDRQRRYLMVNSALGALAGKSPETFVGATSEDLPAFDDDISEIIRRTDLKVLEDGEQMDIPAMRIVGQDGVPRIHHAIKLPFRDEEGHILGLVGISEDVTEKRQVEAELQASRRLLETVLDTIPHSLFVKDREGRYLMVNRALTEQSGKSAEQLIGTTADETPFFNEDTRRIYLEADRRVLDHGEQVNLPDVPVTNSRGEKFLRHIIKLPLRDEAGRIMGLVGISEDITGQRRVEEELRLSRERLERAHARLKDAVESLPGSIALYDSDDRLVLCNRKTLEFFPDHAPLLKPGVPFADIARRSQERNLIKVMDGAPARHVAAMRQREHREATDIIEQEWNDGRWFAVYHRPTSEGGTVSFRLDITDRKRAEEGERTGRQLLQTIFDAVPNWLYVKSPDGRYQTVNRSMAEFHGSPPEAWVGRTYEEVTHLRGNLQLVDHTDAEVVRTARMVDVADSRVVMPDGRVTFRHLIKVPLLDDQGRVRGIVGNSVDVTELRRADAELKESQNLLQTIFDTMPVLLSVKDTNSRYLKVNQEWSSHWGVSPDAAQGRLAAEVMPWPKEQVRMTEEQDQAVLRDGRTLTVVGQIRSNAKQEDRAYQVRKAPLTDGEGNLIGLLATGLDITSRLKAEQALRDSEQRFRDYAESASDWMWEMGPDLRFTWLSDNAEQALGRSSGAFLGKSLDQMAGPLAERDPEGWEQQLRILMQHRPFKDFGYWHPGPDGEPRFVMTSGVPVVGEGGEFRGYRGIGSDQTNLKEAQEALHSERRLLQAVFDTIPLWVFVKDLDGNYLMVNRAATDTIGIDHGQLSGITHDSAPQGTADERERIRAKDQLVIATGETLDEEDALTLPDGRQIVRHVIRRPLRDEADHVVGVLGIAEDITQRKAMEEHLRQSQKIEAIGVLAGGIAHDFNNILFPILGYTELTLETLDQSSEEYANLLVVRDAARRAKGIVAQILLFTRHADARPEVFDPAPQVLEAVSFLRSTLPKNIIIREEIAANVAHIRADTTQFHQVLINLSVNAGQAMPDGGTLIISLTEEDLDDYQSYFGDRVSGHHVRLAVADSGTGMDAATLSHIFEPFFTTKTVGRGTGLGLSSVLGIVKHHEGVFGVHSTPGKGSTFEVYFPTQARAGQSTAASAATAATGCESILFVDDEFSNARLGEKALSGLGYRVTAFTDSRAALQAFQSNPDEFDLVITDQMMPGMTGEQLTKELLRIRPRLPIVMCTGYSDVVTPESKEALGLAGFFHKPASPAELGATVEAALRHARGRAKPE